MSLHRRDFMKLLGVSVASLYLARCQSPTVPPSEQPTCYEAPAPVDTATPTPSHSSTRERLRLYWLRFDELAQSSREDPDSYIKAELTQAHRLELDEFVTLGVVSAPIADLVQEAYDAAVYHVWRSNAPITCYLGTFTYYPQSANVLLEQAATLNQIAGEGTIDPDTLAKAQAALEHDMAFYALTEEDVQALYAQLGRETGQYPSFDKLTLELTPEAKEAAQFLIDLLTGK